MAVKCLEEIEEEAKPKRTSRSRWATSARSRRTSASNNMVLFMRGPDDGQLRVALREGSGIKLDEFRERLRKALPERLSPGWPKRLLETGLGAGPKDRGEQQAKTVRPSASSRATS